MPRRDIVRLLPCTLRLQLSPFLSLVSCLIHLVFIPALFMSTLKTSLVRARGNSKRYSFLDLLISESFSFFDFLNPSTRVCTQISISLSPPGITRLALSCLSPGLTPSSYTPLPPIDTLRPLALGESLLVPSAPICLFPLVSPTHILISTFPFSSLSICNLAAFPLDPFISPH